ncbi:phospholipase-like, Aminotransferase-like mobile domain protein [Artemisia annua]|uniref:Phospholipase-like, Aminotransferase-like mobile domain protein n=1 Tax=Artemisia annua TaxID=35608 RepID=A0A2U1PPA5_ARTAN|nr:phospholipase-like, Aminotransferase-like mobile domain protein [Artemisia annua]
MEFVPMGGEHIWRQLYNQLLDVVSKHRWKHLKGLEASPKYVPTYTLSGFVWAFKIWILESFERSNNWWKKLPDVLPRGVAWSKKEVFTRSDYGLLFGKDSKIHFDLKATLVEQQSDWYIQSQEFIMEYIPKTRKRRAPDEYDVYLQKLDAARKRGRTEKKYLPLVPRIEASSLITEIDLKDRVIQELNSRVFKLESIIQVLACERSCGYREKLDFSRSFCHLSPEFREQLNREFFVMVDTLISNSCSAQKDVDSDDDIVQEYLLQEELMLRNQEEERWKVEEQKLKEMEFLNVLIEEKNRRLEREKLLNEAKERKKNFFSFYKSDHWKRAKADQAKPDKRTQKDGSESSYYWSSKFIEAEKKRTPPNGCRDPDMTQFLKDVKPWVENLSRLNKAIDKVHLSNEYDEYLAKPGPLRCIFP